MVWLGLSVLMGRHVTGGSLATERDAIPTICLGPSENVLLFNTSKPSWSFSLAGEFNCPPIGSTESVRLDVLPEVKSSTSDPCHRKAERKANIHVAL